MKRAAALRKLSDDHHQRLVQVQRLTKAPTMGEGVEPLEETAKTFLEFWQRETSAHFRKEEEVLLPVLARYGQDVSQRRLMEMLAQHAQIRGLVMQLSDEYAAGNTRPETLRDIGDRLEVHIRLEERQVFPMIEEALSEEALKEVTSRLVVKDAGPRAEPWIPTEGLSYDPWPGPGDSQGRVWGNPVTPSLRR
jgi:hemerythrin-like domain-containing protein